MRWILVLALVACREPAPRPVVPAPAPAPAARTLDAFDDVKAWHASGSEGVTAAVRGADGALRLELDLGGTAGYAIARRDLPLELLADFELSFELRGDVPVNHFELKLIDDTGENVWWYRRANFTFPKDWQRISVKRRQIEFAWGPTKDRTLRKVAAIELVVAAGRGGGKGAIEIENLALRPRTPAPVPPPPLRASAPAIVDGDPRTAQAGTAGSQFEIDLGAERDLGGLLVRWADSPADYAVELDRGDGAWTTGARITGGDGGLDPIPLPDASARRVRISLAPGVSGQLAEVELVDAGTPNTFIAAVARALPRGQLPRAWLGEQPYWTIAGHDGGSHTALLSEDAAVELRGGVSIEPFVETAQGVTGWASFPSATQTLVDRYLPIPQVTWRAPGWELEVTALGASQGRLAVRYTVANTSDAPVELALVLALRPLQVNPPTQFLNIAGGVRPIHELAWTADHTWVVDGEPVARASAPPAAVGLWPLHAIGYPVAPIASTPRAITDPAGFASGALRYPLALAPRARTSIVVIAPLDGGLGPAPSDPAAWFERELAAARAQWHAALDRVTLRVPPAAQPIVDTLRSSLAYMLLARDGAALRPGTRSYARAWIRDGAMISEALLRLGHPKVAAAFLAWYAPYQFPSGRVPCCVEPTGAVPVPEHDSHGQLIFLATELYRYTRDTTALAAIWPRIAAAARAIDELRRSERTPGPTFGLMPPSISHEGYSARPAYAYWDDIWALVGLTDAAYAAAQLGKTDDAWTFARSRDELRRDLLASISASAAQHGVAYIPGAADLGDFDATSTTIALAPGDLQRALPENLLAATFERAWTQLQRTDASWTDYTPYELRLVGSFARLGWRARAFAALERYLADRRPAGWNQWAEVVGRVLREPRFIGDMPHAWVHSDYVRSVLDLFAYHRRDDDALVLATGVPETWFTGTGFAIDKLATPFGELGYDVTATPDGSRITFKLAAGRVPPGGIAIPWPFAGPPSTALVDGRPQKFTSGGELVIRRRPAIVVLSRTGVPQ